MDGNANVMTLALDRIISLDYDFGMAYIEFDLDADEYYKDIIGVTVMENQRLMKVKLWIDKSNAPYVITKPFHHSQEILTKNEDGSIIISLSLKVNFEFERLILGFGDSLEVLWPQKFRNRIAYKINRSNQKYSEK